MVQTISIKRNNNAFVFGARRSFVHTQWWIEELNFITKLGFTNGKFKFGIANFCDFFFGTIALKNSYHHKISWRHNNEISKWLGIELPLVSRITIKGTTVDAIVRNQLVAVADLYRSTFAPSGTLSMPRTYFQAMLGRQIRAQWWQWNVVIFVTYYILCHQIVRKQQVQRW